MMATADDVNAEMMGLRTRPTTTTSWRFVMGRIRSPCALSSRRLKEVTLWLRQRAIAKLLTDIGKIDTALEHAMRASSWALPYRFSGGRFPSASGSY